MEDSIKDLQELEEVVKPIQDYIAKHYDSKTEVRVSIYGAEVLHRDSGTTITAYEHSEE